MPLLGCRYCSAPELNDVLHLQHKGIVKIENLDVSPVQQLSKPAILVLASVFATYFVSSPGLHWVEDTISRMQCNRRH